MQPPKVQVLNSGGLFSNPKVTFSKETQDLVNTMMKESRLTNLQKTGFNSLLRSGDSLPANTHEMLRQRFLMRRKAVGKSLGFLQSNNASSSSLPNSGQRKNRYKQDWYPCSGRRTLEQIRASGAYELSPLRPYAPGNSKEKEIQRLQYHMTYGSQEPTESTLVKNKIKDKSKQEQDAEEERSRRFVELVDEISDRIDFLSSMNQIGRDKVYRSMIEFQIREKLTELEKNYPKELVQQVVTHYGLQKFMVKIELPS